jgi:4-amino-4-deoxy-L-arabinose transferase-like glycosyltransferase
MTDGILLGEKLDYLAEGWRPWGLLLALALALFLPGIASLPAIDRDEARFIQATRQMLETGDLVQIRYQDEARNKKPVGIYWLQAGLVRLLSSAEAASVWPYRLASVLGGIAAVLLTFWFGAEIFDRRTSLIAAGLLGSTANLVYSAHIATTDAVQLACIVAVQGALGAAYLAHRRGERLPIRTAAIFWVALGLGMLVKGPVAPGLALVTALALMLADRRWRWCLSLRPFWGVPLALLIILPWLVLIEVQTSGAFLQDSVGRDFFGKLAGAQEAHGAPPLYYLALTPVTFWPASLFLGVGAAWAWRSRRLPAARLLIAWIVPFWIILEIVPTKLPHYILPLYPALALLAAKALVALGEEGMAEPPAGFRPFFPALWATIGLGLGIGLLILPLLPGPLLGLPGELRPTIQPAGGIAAAAVLVAIWQIFVRDHVHLGPSSALVAILAGLLVLVPGLEGVLPSLDALWLSRSAAQLIATERIPGERIGSSGYTEASLVFLLGTDTALVSPEAAAEDLAQHLIGLALIEERADDAFRAALAAHELQPRALGRVRGLDYSNGKRMVLTLYRAEQK